MPSDSQQEYPIQLAPISLADQVTDILRDRIVNSVLKPGSGLVERKLAKMLGVSSAPVREALIRLEKEGLVVSRSRMRHVVELNKEDVVELGQVRLQLEKLAVDLAARNPNQENGAQLLSKLEELRQACIARDATTARKRDMELHRLIWKQSGNRHLFNTLMGIGSPLYMGLALLGPRMHWDREMVSHEDLVDAIVSADRASAVRSIERHWALSFQDILREVEGALVE